MSFGFRKNIHPNIRSGLDARIDALSEYGDTSLRSSQLEPTSKGEFVLTRESQVAKSSFIRMISAGDHNTDVLYGMFNLGMSSLSGIGEHPSSEEEGFSGMDVTSANALDYGMSSHYDLVSSQFGHTAPGIKSATVTFLDGSAFGGAVRKAVVKWICWNTNQLEQYQQGSFLSPGRGIILDWGWSRPDKALNSKLYIPEIIKKTEDGKIELNEEWFIPPKEDDPNKQRSINPWATLPYEKYGDWGGMIGIVTKFDWSMRDDGSFDCTTEILAKGTNIFEEQIKKPNKAGDLAPIGNFQLNDVIKNIKKDLEENLSDEQKASINIEKELDNSPIFNISERLSILDIEIVNKYFNTKDKEYEDESPFVVVSEDKCIVAILKPQSMVDESMLWDGTKYGIDAVTADDKGNLLRAKGFQPEIWIKWGWLEDNIVSFYAPFQDNYKTRQAEFRSVSRDAIGNLKPIKISNHKKLYTHNKSFILPGQFPSDWHPNEDQDGNPNIYKILAENINSSFQPFATDNKRSEGYLRNILVSLPSVRSAFSSPGASISSAMLSLAKNLNSGFSFWDFESHKADNITNANTTYFIRDLKNSSTDDKGESKNTKATEYLENTDTDDDPKNSYIFENYGLNSIIKDISMNSTLSDKFAISAGLGAMRGESNPDPIIESLGRKSKSEESKKAEELGKFFSNPANKTLISNIISPMQGDLQFSKNFGNPRAGNYQKTELNILDDGLKNGTKWNHEISEELVQLVPSSRAYLLDQFNKRLKDSEGQVQQKVDFIVKKDRITALKLDEITMTAIPPENIDDLPEYKDLSLEYKKPYDTTCTLRQHIYQTLTWYLSDNPLRNIINLPKEKYVLQKLPIALSMTIEGLSGINLGNMFRLSYLPANPYGQINADPTTFFTTTGVTHEINSDGWDTAIEGTLMINNKAIERKQDALIKKALGDMSISREELVEKVEKSFQHNLEKMAGWHGDSQDDQLSPAEAESKQLLDKAQEKARRMREAGYKLPPGLGD